MLTPTEFLLLLLGGGLAGGLGGLLGLGGGIIVMPLLRFGFGLSAAEAAGTCIIAVLFTSLGGSLRHLQLHTVHLRSITPILLTSAVAAAATSYVFPALAQRPWWIDRTIGLVFLLVGLQLLLATRRPTLSVTPGAAGSTRILGSPATKAGVGLAAGVLPGLVGIGTGAVLVPLLTLLLKAPIKPAAAASLLCFSATALISGLFKAAQGFVRVDAAIAVSLGTLLGALAGVQLQRRVAARSLALLCSALFAYIAFRFLSAENAAAGGI